MLLLIAGTEEMQDVEGRDASLSQVAKTDALTPLIDWFHSIDGVRSEYRTEAPAMLKFETLRCALRFGMRLCHNSVCDVCFPFSGIFFVNEVDCQF